MNTADETLNNASVPQEWLFFIKKKILRKIKTNSRLSYQDTHEHI